VVVDDELLLLVVLDVEVVNDEVLVELASRAGRGDEHRSARARRGRGAGAAARRERRARAGRGREVDVVGSVVVVVLVEVVVPPAAMVSVSNTVPALSMPSSVSTSPGCGPTRTGRCMLR
jgi:hypothetical protein